MTEPTRKPLTVADGWATLDAQLVHLAGMAENVLLQAEMTKATIARLRAAYESRGIAPPMEPAAPAEPSP